MSEDGLTRVLTRNLDPQRGPLDYAGYCRAGGYEALKTAVGSMTPDAVIDEVTASNLRGRGGAGFPTGKKWSFVPRGDNAPHPKYLVVNADEMEPGTFKDRYLLEGDPHQMMEAIAISAYAVGADVAFIFLRDAYRNAYRILKRALDEAYENGVFGPSVMGSDFSLKCHVHTSAGRYICGEETALLSALEGKRPLPRQKPPFPQASGLWGQPTIVNNVETLCNVPHIVRNGGEWYNDLAESEDGGTKLYGVSGHVNRPGLWELPIGTTAREIIEEHAGGMKAGRTLRGFLPGGGSTGFLTEAHLDIPLDYGSTEEAGSRLGTGCIIVLDDQTCPVGVMRNLEHFFAQESCGWCTPCRDGLPWTERLLAAMEAGQGRERDIEVLEMHARFLGPGKTYCAHAPGAVTPLQTALKHFREDFETHVRDGRCPYS